MQHAVERSARRKRLPRPADLRRAPQHPWHPTPFDLTCEQLISRPNSSAPGSPRRPPCLAAVRQAQRMRDIKGDCQGHVSELLATVTQTGKLEDLVAKEDQEMLLEALHSWARSTRTVPTRPGSPAPSSVATRTTPAAASAPSPCQARRSVSRHPEVEAVEQPRQFSCQLGFPDLARRRGALGQDHGLPQRRRAVGRGRARRQEHDRCLWRYQERDRVRAAVDRQDACRSRLEMGDVIKMQVFLVGDQARTGTWISPASWKAT